MLSFKQRSYKKELLDGANVPFAAIKRNMQELNVINQRLGGHDVTLKGMAHLIGANQLFQNPISVVEIGCGGGDNLRVVQQWAQQKGIDVQLTGVDINKACIQFAREQIENNNIKFICADYKEVIFDQQPQIIFSSLFCHHFTNEELVSMLQWMQRQAQLGFFINDLHRHPLAYSSIKMLTQTFSKSYMVKNDAPLSVLRGFSKKDWQQLFEKANITNYTCQWQWAFRWLVTCKK